MSAELNESVKFLQACPPPMEAGDYRIRVKQELSVAGSENLPESIDFFIVRGPRFSLAATDVYSTFPPPNQQGSFGNCLPHIILNRRTLPWERTITGFLPQRPAGDTNDPPVPWMTLLSFSAAEGIEIKQGTVDNLLHPPAGVMGPSLILDQKAGETGSDPCCMIDIPTALFTMIIPSLCELRYLAHARYAATDNKAIEGDGWTSCILGNRLPETSDGGADNGVFLVSLEGWGDYLPGGDKTIDSSIQYVRLIVLYHWKFRAQTQQLHFAQLIDGLSIGALAAPVKSDAEATVGTAVQMGYVGLPHHLRSGGQTVSWYRSPLVPLALSAGTGQSASCADELVKYSPQTGLFDVSYAAAWQLGRLLALQNQHFAVAAVNWRRQNTTDAVCRVTRSYLSSRLPQLLQEAKSHTEEYGNFKTNLGVHLIAAIGGGVVPRQVGVIPLLGEHPDITGIKNKPDKFPGLLSKKQLEAWKDLSENDRYAMIKQQIIKGETL